MTAGDYVEWLRRERCPYCANGRGCDATSMAYKVAQTRDGWRCWGYRTKYVDEPFDFRAVTR